jgi:hypothetical protein
MLFDLARNGGTGGVMTDFGVPVTRGPLFVTLAVRPEELELAFATEGDTLRQRLMLAIIAELTIPEAVEAI